MFEDMITNLTEIHYDDDNHKTSTEQNHTIYTTSKLNKPRLQIVSFPKISHPLPIMLVHAFF